MTRYWQHLSITTKIYLALGLLFAIIVGNIVTNSALNILVRGEAEDAILASTEAQSIVLEMDRTLSHARRAEREFFLRYRRVGIAEAQANYSSLVRSQIAEVNRLSVELQELIDTTSIGESFRNANVNLPLYLSSAERYATTFDEAVVLVEQLVAPPPDSEDERQEISLDDSAIGVEIRLDAASLRLQAIFQSVQDPTLLLQYRAMRAFEKDYLLTRQRPLIQSALNVATSLRQTINNSNALTENQRTESLALLEAYIALTQQLPNIDRALLGKFNDFDLQTQAFRPITDQLVQLTNAEVEAARLELEEASQIEGITFIVAGLLSLLVVVGIGLVVDRTITRNIVQLTDAAHKLAQGSLDKRVPVTSSDELGALAQSFNTMVGRLQASFATLEEANLTLQQRSVELEQQITQREAAQAELEKEIINREKAQQEREQLQKELIGAQAKLIRDLSTPIIPVTDDIIILPLIGSVNAERAKDIIRSLLEGITEHKAKVVIIDITGVSDIDVDVADYLDKAIQAARLKGTRTIITGVSDAVAEIVTDLGINWNDIETLRDLRTGLNKALRRTNGRSAQPDQKANDEKEKAKKSAAKPTPAKSKTAGDTAKPSVAKPKPKPKTPLPSPLRRLRK